MPSLQYVIDTICASVSPAALFRMVETRLADGSFPVDNLIPEIQARDRSLDAGSARSLAEAAAVEMEERGIKARRRAYFPGQLDQFHLVNKRMC